MKSPDFDGLLKRAIGLDENSVGISAIERAVQARIAACEAPDARAYWNLVRRSSAELQELVDAIVVPETWFFRDPGAFAAMQKLALSEWLPTHPEGSLQLLSLPCSTGEEPFSVAMALLDAGFAPDRFDIDAVDVCTRSLGHARTARYGRNSFRGGELGFRDRHFEATGDAWQLCPEVAGRVRIHHGNLFSLDRVLGVRVYDMIFCRNLLIYFDVDTQRRALQLLHDRLAPNGVLFVAPCETSLALQHGFVACGIPRSFAFRRQHAATPPPKAPRPATPAPVARRAPGRVPAPVGGEPVIPMALVLDGSAGLNEATRMADEGKLSEAAMRCEAHLAEHGASVQAFHLLGVINAAAGDDAVAERCYRKALYLDPDHGQTLIHLALLLEQRGDGAGARLLRARLARLETRVGD